MAQNPYTRIVSTVKARELWVNESIGSCSLDDQQQFSGDCSGVANEDKQVQNGVLKATMSELFYQKVTAGVEHKIKDLVCFACDLPTAQLRKHRFMKKPHTKTNPVCGEIVV